MQVLLGQYITAVQGELAGRIQHALMDAEIMCWTAKRKPALVLQIFLGKTSVWEAS
ncbi:MAG: hypothetical protein DSM106950_11575 [Stigonema ocellatum SAG 48.90 = DSM 106950]|nr:hypothetical protein [Stigonema ocellatum SAG 48.90 = DSM 106950]